MRRPRAVVSAWTCQESSGALNEHRAINYISNATGGPLDWRFHGQGEDLTMSMPSRFAVNETEAYLQCGLLAAARSSAVPVSIVYPHGRNASGATRTFVGWIAELFEQSDFKRGL